MSVMADLNSQSRQMMQLIRARFGQFDQLDITAIEDEDGRCFTASKQKSVSRSGMRIGSFHPSLVSAPINITVASFSALPASEARSLSVWLLGDNQSSGTQALAGWGNRQSEAGYFGLVWQDGDILITLGSDNITTTTPLELKDNHWHHIALVSTGMLDKSDTALFVDGEKHSLSFPDGISALNTDKNSDNNSGLTIAGSAGHEPDFNGALSALTLYDIALSDDQVQALFKQDAEDTDTQTASEHLVLHYALSETGEDNQSMTDLSDAGWQGIISDPSAFSSFTATHRSTQRQQIGLYPAKGAEDIAGLYAAYLLLDGTTALCPDTPDGRAIALTDAIFDPDESRFFSLPDNQTGIVFHAAVEHGDTGLGQKPIAHASPVSHLHEKEALCRIDPGLTFQDIRTRQCMFSSAYIYIADDLYFPALSQGNNDRLYIAGASATIQDNHTLFEALPFDKDAGLSAIYDPQLKLLEINAQDRQMSGAEWQQILRAVSFSTPSDITSTRREFVFSLGAPAYFLSDGRVRYTQFTDRSDNASFTASDAFEQAAGASLCGVDGQLAILSGHAEQQAVARTAFSLEVDRPRWVRGWLGGTDNDTEGRWVWHPSDRQFWSGSGAEGSPVNAAAETLNVAYRQGRDIGFDMPDPADSHPLSLLEITLDNDSEAAEFTAWAYQQDALNPPDNMTADADYLVMSIDSNARSLWANQPQDIGCLAETEEGAVFSACGYFQQFEDNASGTLPVLALRRTLNISDRQHLCF